MKEIYFGTLDKLKDLKGIEKIIWCSLGIKRCTDFNIPDGKQDELVSITNAFDLLGLTYDGDFIKIKNWPSWEWFAERHHNSKYSTVDFPTGLFYDIPICCAKAFQINIEQSYDNFFARHPLLGQRTSKQVVSMDKELLPENTNIFDLINKHAEKYNFKEKFDISGKTVRETNHLISKGKLPESLFLLKGLTYVQCQPDCSAFMSQTDKMLKSMQMYVGNNKASNILEEYKKLART